MMVNSLVSIPVVFTDLDSTLQIRSANSVDDQLILPVCRYIDKFARREWKVIGITNQGEHKPGGLTDDQIDRELSILRAHLRLSNFSFSDFPIYYCPHGPGERCKCKKPSTFMFAEAKASLAMGGYAPDMSVSFMIGDQFTDYEFANNCRLSFISAQEILGYPRPF